MHENKNSSFWRSEPEILCSLTISLLPLLAMKACKNNFSHTSTKHNYFKCLGGIFSAPFLQGEKELAALFLFAGW